jgi:hypothetical protein
VYGPTTCAPVGETLLKSAAIAASINTRPVKLAINDWRVGEFGDFIGRSLNDIDRVRRHPDVDLPEAGFQSFLELAEEVSVLRHVVNINDNAHGVVFEHLVLMVPFTSHGLGFPHHGAELKSHS